MTPTPPTRTVGTKHQTWRSAEELPLMFPEHDRRHAPGARCQADPLQIDSTRLCRAASTSKLVTQHATAAELDRKLPATGTMAASTIVVAVLHETPHEQERAGDQDLTYFTCGIYLCFRYFPEEVPCVVCRCGRGHDGTFLLTPAKPHVSNSRWVKLQTSAASFNLPEAYFT